MIDLDDVAYHVEKQGLDMNVYNMYKAFSKQIKTSQKKYTISLENVVEIKYNMLWDVIDCKIKSDRIHRILIKESPEKYYSNKKGEKE